MKKHIKNFALLMLVVTGLIVIANKVISVLSGLKDDLPMEKGKFYKWKYGDIYYTKTGKGKPVLLLHDLNPTSSAYEWERVVKKLSRTNTVYAIDLLGCGRSEKPNLTYTNYLYVQLINDFIRDVIAERTDIVATGTTFSCAIMACQMENKYFGKLIGVNPTDLYELVKAPGKRKNLLKFAIDLPVLGTFIYNLAMSKNKILDEMLDYNFYKEHLVSPELVNAYYKAAHTGDGNGRYLLASIRSYYTNINIVPALKKINNSICLIGGKECPFMNEIMKDYHKFNPAIEEAYISNASYLPQLESPEKFVELLNIILNEDAGTDAEM